MAIIAGETYHTYNQGNNREKIFYHNDDYSQFLALIRKYILPDCHILAYCLMPNHFHFLVYATENSAEAKRVGNINSTKLANGFRLLQSSYAQSINKKQNRSGSLFRQKTKFKPVITDKTNYGPTAFHYIHQNPYKAGLVAKLEDWAFSSFRDFTNPQMETICNKQLALEILDFDIKKITKDSYKMIDEEEVKNIFF